MTVAEAIKELQGMPQDAPVATMSGLVERIMWVDTFYDGDEPDDHEVIQAVVFI